MATLTVNSTYNIAGINFAPVTTRTAPGVFGHDLSVSDATLSPAYAGTLTTRTDANTGTITGEAGHGIQTGDIVDIYWSGGVQSKVTVGTVSVNSIPFDSGVGNDLPIATTSITICKRTVINGPDFDGDDVEFLSVLSNYKGHVDFQESDGTTIYAGALTAGEAFDDYSEIAGETVGKIAVSTGQTGTAQTMKVGVLYDSV